MKKCALYGGVVVWYVRLLSFFRVTIDYLKYSVYSVYIQRVIQKRAKVRVFG